MPALQSSQVTTDSGEYLPATHAVHEEPAELTAAPVPPIWTMLPAAQAMHTSEVAAVEVEYLPATQSMQSDAATLPLAATYLPAMHAMQSSAVGPEMSVTVE